MLLIKLFLNLEVWNRYGNNCCKNVFETWGKKKCHEIVITKIFKNEVESENTNEIINVFKT